VPHLQLVVHGESPDPDRFARVDDGNEVLAGVRDSERSIGGGVPHKADRRIAEHPAYCAPPRQAVPNCTSGSKRQVAARAGICTPPAKNCSAGAAVDRLGEAAIARDAASLRERALRRIAQLQAEPEADVERLDPSRCSWPPHRGVGSLRRQAYRIEAPRHRRLNCARISG
jgi:hypothetical protein